MRDSHVIHNLCEPYPEKFFTRLLIYYVASHPGNVKVALASLLESGISKYRRHNHCNRNLITSIVCMLIKWKWSTEQPVLVQNFSVGTSPPELHRQKFSELFRLGPLLGSFVLDSNSHSDLHPKVWGPNPLKTPFYTWRFALVDF